ncbi:type II CRISPR-associated endonuclease Cas1 [Gemella sp. GH3]|uniref:type II CRISPR-associated endonuclease Cas1 n=1 Tax=unclassified Gemella TaxID=2624949 RepID=UPI0015D069A6|nr:MULTISPECIES: type II CRISPR-associated endonuclease Cas1 [unclassified Gemella]MBF0714025.1 type II CRISPR-associated endonuclease Cas1 [Gemella sp. GH3.1]NYS50977.1 type II CRISPR-associated endonuclease Cas1 [Gemella sp. GH3]
MSWRTVVIRERAKLDYKMNYMIVRRSDDIKRISISELYMVILESTAVSITAVLLNELNKNKVSVVFCDEKRSPYANLIGLYGSHDTSLKYRLQTKWQEYTMQEVWTKIVYEKIKNQYLVLKKLNLEGYHKLMDYLEELEFNDVTNREGHAAKIYFNSLFGKDFSRSQECFVNAALNYGYSILLSSFNREINASGYATQFGIFHNNQYNSFNLSCDLMEPYRVLVDLIVYNLKGSEFESMHKNIIIKLLNDYVVIEGKKQTVANSIKIYTKSIFRVLNNDDISQLSFFDYEL